MALVLIHFFSVRVALASVSRFYVYTRVQTRHLQLNALACISAFQTKSPNLSVPPIFP